MLKAITADEAINVDNLVVVIGGDPKTGKTSLACTGKNPVVFDFDGGSYRANRQGLTYRPTNWVEFTELINAPETLSGRDTVVFDTIGSMAQCYLDDLIGSNPKMSAGGNPSLRAYGQLKTAMIREIERIRRKGKDLVIVGHLKEEYQGEEVRYRLNVVGATKDVVYQQADIMGRLFVNGQGNRVFEMTPTEASFGSNPARLPTLIVPDPLTTGLGVETLAEIIAKTKKALNEQAQEAQWQAQAVRNFRAELNAYTGPDEFTTKANELIERKAHPVEKSMLMDVAREKGYRWDKTAKTFIEDERDPELH